MILHVDIISGNQNALCQNKCGLDWSDPEVQKQVSGELMKKFGDCVQIKYTGTVSPKISGAGNYLLIIDGQVRLSGAFDKHELIEMIETELEVGGWG
jgi:hypothetical protein